MTTRERIRERVDAWLAEHLDGGPTIDLGAVVTSGVKDLSRDEELTEAAASVLLRAFLLSRAHVLIRRRRLSAKQDGGEGNPGEGGAPPTEGEVERLRRTLGGPSTEDWYEHDGEQYFRVYGPAATRTALGKAIEGRVKQTIGNLVYASSLKRLRDGLSPGEAVPDAFERREVAEILDQEDERIRRHARSPGGLIEAARRRADGGEGEEQDG